MAAQIEQRNPGWIFRQNVKWRGDLEVTPGFLEPEAVCDVEFELVLL